ncbi:MAG: hypothetical protein AAF141_15995 [Pseudomonadota bacterium]
MPSLTLDQSVRGVKFSALVLIGFGLLTAAAAHPTMAAPTDWVLRVIMFDLSRDLAINTPEERLMVAILGGIILGWGVTIFAIAEGWYRSAPQAAGRAIVTATTAWFVVDGIGSVLSGSAMNIVPNIGFFAILVLPVLLYSGRKQAAPA